MASPIVTLTTDFGLRDPVVGIVKGVILGICRDARLVDLSHEVRPHDIEEGALALGAAWRFFPPGSIHLAVIDPGVGSARRALGLTAGGHYFVGPDNGLFTFALGVERWSAVSIEAPSYRLPAVSGTFHARDIFAPAAAYLGLGVPLDRLGPRVADPVRLPLVGCRVEGGEIIGEVIGSDRFGNLLTSVTADRVDAFAAAGPVVVALGERDLGSMVQCYEEGASGVPRPIIRSSGRLEVFVRKWQRACPSGPGRGTRVRLRRP
jgi:S-adenosylmethionine hydrolase